VETAAFPHLSGGPERRRFSMREKEHIPDLVRRAVAQPLVVREGEAADFAHALREWGETMAKRWPLWALEAEAYRRMNASPALTYPMSRFVESICRDEDLCGTPSSGSLVEGLDALVDRRRLALVSGERFAWDTAEITPDGVRSWWSFGTPLFPRVLDGPVLACYEPDTPYSTGGYCSPYEEIGIELVSLLDRRNAAAAKSPERAAAKRALDEFLIGVGGSVHGHPTTLRTRSAKTLAREGFALFEALWSALGSPIQVDPRASHVLQALGGPGTDVEEYALRLVLPTLSALEIKALRDRVRAPHRPVRGVAPAVEFCVHVTAHRMAVPVESVTRKMKDGWLADMLAGDNCLVCGIRHHLRPEQCGPESLATAESCDSGKDV
jgi:hypothetical protein